MPRSSIKVTPLNWPVVLATALLCGLSLVLFFVTQHKRPTPAPLPADTLLVDDPYSELDYYNQMADEYIAMLPVDREVVARLVDDSNHYIYYFEHTDHPSCYCYDLESLTTSVLFGGTEGFYADTKLLIIGAVKEWKRVGDRIYFVAANRAPEAGYPDAVVVFVLHIDTRLVEFVATAAGAYFADDTRLTLQRAKVVYVNLFTDEPVYTTETVTISL